MFIKIKIISIKSLANELRSLAELRIETLKQEKRYTEKNLNNFLKKLQSIREDFNREFEQILCGINNEIKEIINTTVNQIEQMNQDIEQISAFNISKLKKFISELKNEDKQKYKEYEVKEQNLQKKAGQSLKGLKEFLEIRIQPFNQLLQNYSSFNSFLILITHQNTESKSQQLNYKIDLPPLVEEVEISQNECLLTLFLGYQYQNFCYILCIFCHPDSTIEELKQLLSQKYQQYFTQNDHFQVAVDNQICTMEGRHLKYYQIKNGWNIEPFSCLKNEKEVIMPPYSQYVVESVSKQENQPIYVKLRELPQPRSSQILLWIDDNPENNYQYAQELEKENPLISVYQQKMQQM